MRLFLLSAAFLSSVAVACSFHIGGETNGTHGNADFSYSNCFLGCTTTTPMMLGDEEIVSVTGSLPASVSIETTAPSVVSVKSADRQCCSSNADGGGSCREIALNDACDPGETGSLNVTVDAATVGSSVLLVKKSDGSVWDSVSLSVEQAASLSLACNTAPNVTMAPNAECPITWVAKDSTGRGLMSTAGLHLTSSDKSIVALSGFLTTNQSDMVATPQILGDVTAHAVATGDATITGTAGGVTETLAIHVAP
jgi:hypothetical protein